MGNLLALLFDVTAGTAGINLVAIMIWFWIGVCAIGIFKGE